ncbi:MAG: aldolase/citrate lyase family protein [Vicinamibacterales bacterium]
MHTLRLALLPAALAALAVLSTPPLDAQAPAAFPADGNVAGSHWSRLVNVAAAGRVIFGSFTPGKSPDDAVAAARNPLPDFWFYDMEHTPFDMETFRTWLQFTLDPTALRRPGPPRITPVLVRIPANGREMNQWMAKQILDTGGLGVVTPHIETAAQARNVVRATRYRQAEGAADFEPEGQRGSGAGNAVRFLGAPFADYMRKADVWPLDPDGEIFNLLLIENGEGVRNIAEIVRVPGVSAVAAAPGDLGAYHSGDRARVERDIQTIVDACTAVKMICGITAGAGDVERRIQQGFTLLIGDDAMIRAGHAVAKR